MARARNIKPSFFTNDSLAETGPYGMLLFEALWCLSDREGRLEDRPKKIKIEALPYFDVDVDGLLNLLHNAGFIVRYANNDTRYIQVVNFGKHQNPHVKEAPSTIPAPDKHSVCTVPAGLIPDSGFPLTDSGLLIPESQTDAAGAAESEESAESDPSDPPKVKRPRATYPADFETFWQAYPSGHGIKGKAFERWKQINPDDALFAEIMAGLKKWLACERWENGFIKGAEIWLRDAWWANEPPPRKVLQMSSNGTRPPVETFNGSPVYKADGSPTAAYFAREAARLGAEAQEAS